jgi:large subunit ribosomal protein L24
MCAWSRRRFRASSGKRTQGGIADQESPINVSNVALVCPNCGPAKVGTKTEGDVRVRICKKCGQPLPTKNK